MEKHDAELVRCFSEKDVSSDKGEEVQRFSKYCIV